MLSRLIDRFWAWENRRRDPDALIRCANPGCEEHVRRADFCCSDSCWDGYREVQTY